MRLFLRIFYNYILKLQLNEYGKILNLLSINIVFKDLRRVKPNFKSVPPQFYFEIAGPASAVKWHEIQNIDEEERF